MWFYDRTSNLINTRRTVLYTMVPTATYHLHIETEKNYFFISLLKSLSTSVFSYVWERRIVRNSQYIWDKTPLKRQVYDGYRLFRNKCRQQGNSTFDAHSMFSCTYIDRLDSLSVPDFIYLESPAPHI